jgi:hypothetical protein
MSGCPHDIPAMRVSKGNVRPTTDVSSSGRVVDTNIRTMSWSGLRATPPTGTK